MNKFKCIESDKNEKYVVGNIYYFDFDNPRYELEFSSLSFKTGEYNINGHATFVRVME